MRRAYSSERDRDPEKLAQVEKVVAEILRQRGAGTAIDEAAIVQSHPELEPELGRRLRALRTMEAAAQRLKAGEHPGPHVAAEDAPFQEGLDFLRVALRNYDILEPISYGGQGVVYKAIQHATRRTVAIKVLLDGPLASERQRRRFLREVALTSRLQHPNIVAVYESDVVRGRVYCALEYVEGIPLDDYVLLHGLSAADIVRLFATVVRAVSYAHQQGIIHRDLNPANVLVDLDGVPRILDFGLAKDVCTGVGVSDAPSLTMTGQVIGTLPYLSPEQAGAQDGEVDVRSDIYSLGIMLFVLLTGGFPYPVDESPASVRAAIVSRDPLTLRRAISSRSVSPLAGADLLACDLEAILLKALLKDKEARYQSAAAFADDLEHALAGDIVAARADHRYYLLQNTFRKYRTAAMVAGALLFIVGAAGAAVTVMWTQARLQRDNARSVARVAIGTLDDVITRVDDSVQRLAGGTEVRGQLLNDVVAGRLELLAPLVESDAAMNDLRAALYEKQGDIAYARGSYVDAARNYQQFLDLAGPQPRTADSDNSQPGVVARAQRKLANVVTDANDHFRHAIAVGESLVKSRPGQAAEQYDLCLAHVEYGRHLNLRGEYELAGEQIDAALLIAERFARSIGREDRWIELLARAYGWEGDTAKALGDGMRSVAALTESLSLCRELSEARPADVERRHQVLVACTKLARVLRDEGQTKDAEAVFSEAVSVGDYLTSADPSIAAWRRDLLGAHYGLALLALSQGNPELGQVHCEAALALAQQLIAREPTNVSWRADLAFSHDLRGQVYMALDEPEKACDDYETSLWIRESLAAEHPRDLAMRKEVGTSDTRLGSCWRRLGNPEQALQYFENAHAVAETLHTQQPSVPQRAIDLVRAKINLASGHMIFRTNAHDVEAQQLLQDACTYLGELVSEDRCEVSVGTCSSLMTAISDNLALLDSRVQHNESADREPSGDTGQ